MAKKKETMAQLLTRLYETEDKSLRDISDIVGISHSTIRRLLMKYGIPVRSAGRPFLNEEDLLTKFAIDVDDTEE